MASKDKNQYRFQIDGLELPIAPPSLTIKINNKNETLTLINEGEVNIPKLPGLTEISFTARIPQRQYPFASKLKDATVYTDKFKTLKLTKKNFMLVIIRPPVSEITTVHIYDKNKKRKERVKSIYKGYSRSVFNVVLEDYTIKEDAEEGLDLLIDLNFKEYVGYSTKVYKKVTTSNADGEKTVIKSGFSTEVKKVTSTQTYTVVEGDTIIKIARKFYGGFGLEGSKKIYEANKEVIESTAKKNGKESSCKGWWLFPGTKLTIPPNA